MAEASSVSAMAVASSVSASVVGAEGGGEAGEALLRQRSI